jgi:hypothetical protein
MTDERRELIKTMASVVGLMLAGLLLSYGCSRDPNPDGTAKMLRRMELEEEVRERELRTQLLDAQVKEAELRKRLREASP